MESLANTSRSMLEPQICTIVASTACRSTKGCICCLPPRYDRRNFRCERLRRHRLQAPLGFFRFFFPLDIEEDDDPPRLSFADKRVCRLKFFLYPFGIFVLSVKKLGFYFMPSKELLYVYKVASLAKRCCCSMQVSISVPFYGTLVCTYGTSVVTASD